MILRMLLILTLAGMVVMGAGGCSSPPQPGALAPTGTPVLHLSPTPLQPRAPHIGELAPDFTLDTLDGTLKIHLSDFRGKTILLFFWAIDCSPCVKEQSVIQRFFVQQQAAGKQMVVLGVDVDKASDFVNVARLQQRLGLTYLILVDDHYQARFSYQITDLPIAYFLDRQHVRVG